jgi:hypothetical protein
MAGTWQGALASIAAFGFVGALIDFFLSKSDQRRLKGWLETWWIKLSYVRWGNFGREEALFAVQMMDRGFGRKIYSIRRILSLIVIIVTAIIFRLAPLLVREDSFSRISFEYDFDTILLLITSIIFLISISITRFSAVIVAKRLEGKAYKNFLALLSLLLVQYVLLCYSSNLQDFVFGIILDASQLGKPADNLAFNVHSMAYMLPMWRDVASAMFALDWLSPSLQIDRISNLFHIETTWNFSHPNGDYVIDAQQFCNNVRIYRVFSY